MPRARQFSEPSLSSPGASGLRFCSPWRLKTKNRFRSLHQIEAITRNRLKISRVCFKHIDLASLPRQQRLLFVYLLLQIIDFGPALHESFVRWNEQTHNHQPDSEDEQDAKNSVKSLPNCGFATRTEVAVGLIHLAHLSAVYGFVTKFLLDSQELVVLRDAISPAKRASFDLAGVSRNRDVRDCRIFGFAGAVADDHAIIIFLRQINRGQGLCERAD